MKKYLLALLFLVGAISPILVIRAASTDFALVAISPIGQKAVCVKQPQANILEALSTQGFQPKQDDTGFIYSLIGYDGPLSSESAAQSAFWGFWIGNNFSFSNLGPAQVKPEAGQLYLFNFGDGSKPTVNISYEDVCKPEPTPTPSTQSPIPSPTTLPATNQSDLSASWQYLRAGYSAQAVGNQDWAALALGSHGQGIETSSSDSESVLSLSRNVLARAAQGLDRTTQVNKIKNSYSNNQFGDPALINDDIFAVLALQSTDVGWLKDRQSVFDTIISSQRSNGSFGFSKGGDGDVDMTAAAIWSLVYKQVGPTNAINKADAYLAGSQNSDGGFGFKPNTNSNVASTSWALLAERALGSSNPTAENYLLSNKQSGGYWLFSGEPSYLNTAYAVLALSGKKMPIVGIKSSNPPPLPVPAPNPQSHTVPQKKVRQKATSDVISESFSNSITCSASANASASATGGNASASASATAICN